eukprot:1166931-Pyramimonas_sp.AAC.1
MTGTAAAAGPPATSAGQPASSSTAGQHPTATVLATDAPVSLVAESADAAGAPAEPTPAGLPANEARLKRIERFTDRSMHWLRAPYGSVPHGRPLRTRRTENPESARSGASAISERDMLHVVPMVNADGQTAVRADEGTVENAPLSPQHHHMHGEYPSAWISQKHPITAEEARGYEFLCVSG